MLALAGALLYWLGTVSTVLFAVVLFWLLFAEGVVGAWYLIPIGGVVWLLGYLLVRHSRIPLSDALNL